MAPEPESTLARPRDGPPRAERVAQRRRYPSERSSEVAGEALPRVDHHCGAGGLGRRLPRLRLGQRLVTIHGEQHVEELHTGDPVDHAVVDLGDHGPATLGQALDHPGFPQRAIAMEWLRHEPAHEPAQVGVAARRGQRRMAEVVREVEVRVVLPHRSAEREGSEPHALPVAGDEVELGGEQPPELVHGRGRALEHRDAGDVHVRDPVLHVQELGIEGAQPLHGHHPPKYVACTVGSDASSSAGPCAAITPVSRT